MIQIVYISAANQFFTPQALATLVAKARVRNALYDVTGLLLYHAGSFLQVLEGPESGVGVIYASVANDPSHTDIRLLRMGPIACREFADWPMAFIDTSKWRMQTPGLVDYRREVPQLDDVPTQAGRYLSLFFDGLCRQAAA